MFLTSRQNASTIYVEFGNMLNTMNLENPMPTNYEFPAATSLTSAMKG